MLAKTRVRVSKAYVHYREARKDAKRHCGNCAMYHNGSCDLVEGRISPGDVCDKWVKRG